MAAASVNVRRSCSGSCGWRRNCVCWQRLLSAGVPPPVRNTPSTLPDLPKKAPPCSSAEKHCSMCHAVNGSGGRVAPDLGAMHPGTPAMGWLITVIWNHMPGMWRQMHGEKPQLNQEDMAHILAFLYQAGPRTSRATPRPARASSMPRAACGAMRCVPMAALRPRSFQSGGCRRCLAWMHAMWNHAQSMIEPVTKEMGTWPQFTGGGDERPGGLRQRGTFRRDTGRRRDCAAARITGGKSSRQSASMSFGARQRRQGRSRTGTRSRTAAELRAIRRRAVEPRSGDVAACARGEPGRADAAGRRDHGRPALSGQPAIFRAYGIAFPGRARFRRAGLRELPWTKRRWHAQRAPTACRGRRLYHGLFRDGAVEPRSRDEHHAPRSLASHGPAWSRTMWAS